MAKIVVTGGCGFIGSHLVDKLCQLNHHVVVIDNLQTSTPSYIEPWVHSKKLTLIKADINNHSVLKENLVDVESVFHLAARISVPESIQQPIAYFETNCLGTLNLLNACRDNQVKNVVFSSSAAVYGNNPVIPKREDMPVDPQSPYAITKVDGELNCQFYRKQFGLNVSILRYFNVFGPRQNLASAYASVIPIFIHRALQDKVITIFGDGEQTRDFVFVKDVAEANLAAARHPGDIFNVANGESITVNELAKLIIKLTNSKSRIDYQPMRAGDIIHSQGDNTKIREKISFQSKHAFTRALTETIEYYAEKLPA